jgi:hypothetical protein
MEHNLDNSSLINDLLNPTKEQNQQKCKVGRMLDMLPEETSEAIKKAIKLIRTTQYQGKNKTYSSVWLSKVLRKNGYPISPSTIQRHVNKECSCEQSD